MANHTFRDATDQNAPEASASLACHDNQIRLRLGSDVNDPSVRRSLRHMMSDGYQRLHSLAGQGSQSAFAI